MEGLVSLAEVGVLLPTMEIAEEQAQDFRPATNWEFSSSLFAPKT
jgi:hypothetical protein